VLPVPLAVTGRLSRPAFSCPRFEKKTASKGEQKMKLLTKEIRERLIKNGRLR
jgi:hypothetical protein